MISLVIFDCDGVLFESAGANIAFYNAVLERLGRPPLDEAWARRAHYLSSAPALRRDVRRRHAGGRRCATGEPRGRLRAVLPPDAADAGPRVGHAGIVRALSDRDGDQSRCHRRRRRARVRARPLVHADGRGERRRPAQAASGHARCRCLEHFRVPPTAAAYVGDSETDHQAALAAGDPVHRLRPGGAGRRTACTRCASCRRCWTRCDGAGLSDRRRQKTKGKSQKSKIPRRGSTFAFRLLPFVLSSSPHPSMIIPPSTGMH